VHEERKRALIPLLRAQHQPRFRVGKRRGGGFGIDPPAAHAWHGLKNDTKAHGGRVRTSSGQVPGRPGGPGGPRAVRPPPDKKVPAGAKKGSGGTSGWLPGPTGAGGTPMTPDPAASR